MTEVLSSNVFALLDDENEDPQQLAATAQKAAPKTKAAAPAKPGAYHHNAISVSAHPFPLCCKLHVAQNNAKITHPVT